MTHFRLIKHRPREPFCGGQRLDTVMQNHPIDPEIALADGPESTLRTTDEAIAFLTEMARRFPDDGWGRPLRAFLEIATAEGALEETVRLELLLEERGMLVEDALTPMATIATPWKTDADLARRRSRIMPSSPRGLKASGRTAA
jgi:hypothetical protein